MQPEVLKTYHEGQKRPETTRQHDCYMYVRVTHFQIDTEQHAQLYGTLLKHISGLCI